MNLSLRIFGKEIFGLGAEKRSGVSDIKDPQDWLVQALGGINIAGVKVNQNTALTFSGYYGSVKILMETMGILPVASFKKDGNVREEVEHPASRLLSVKPNSYQTPQLWHETMVGYACNRGNAYSFIIRDEFENPVALEMPEKQSDITPVLYEGDLFYKVYGIENLVPSRDIFHIRGLSFDGIEGLSLIQVAKAYIAGGVASQEYSNDIHQSGGAERTALVVPGKLDEDQENKMREEWRRKHGQHAKTRGELSILQAGMDVKTIGMSPEDAQLIESKKISIEDFSRYTRIPLHMLNHLDKAGYNSLEHMGREFVLYTMQPWIEKFTQEANDKLYREVQKNDQFTYYDTSALTRGDSQAMAELVSKTFPAGALNADEIRWLVYNLNPRGDSHGQEYKSAVNVHSDAHAEAKKKLVESKIKELENEEA